MADEAKILADKMERARLALSWEMLWRLAWPLPAWIALFAGVALLDLLPLLSPWLHRAALVGFFCGLVALAARLRHFRLPDRRECQRRLERDSALPHRPLALLDDRLPDRASPMTAALWQLERARAIAAIRRLRLKPPAPGLPALDPWGLRFAALLVLAVGLAVGAGDAASRLDRALDPGLGDGTPPPMLQIWITPPRYTGLSPILLPAGGAGTPLAVPQGSALLAELQGTRHAARLEIDDNSLTFDRLDPDSQKIETLLRDGHRLRVRLGWRLLGQWAIAVTPDQPPQVGFTDPPTALADGKLRIGIAASDDYGVEHLALTLHRIDAIEDDNEIPLEAGGQKQLTVDQALDLAAHPWSGLRVTLRPVAQDGAGQSGTGAAVTLRLPEREFHHPVARALAGLRSALAADSGQLAQTVQGLAVLASRPDQFKDDSVVYLQITTARSRLIHDRGPQAIPSSLDMMWAAAIRIEDGDLPDARDAVDQASQALRDALAKGASDDDITRLTRDLQQAMQRLIATLGKRAGQAADQTEGASGRALSSDQLTAMLGQLSDLAHAGARQAAQQSLRALQDLLDHLSPGSGTNPSAAPGENQDPLGRGIGRDGTGVKLPAPGDLSKAREILDELRRRAAEARRPAAERDYLRRLLDRLY